MLVAVWRVAVCVCVVLIRDFGAFCIYSLINVSLPNYDVCCLYFE